MFLGPLRPKLAFLGPIGPTPKFYFSSQNLLRNRQWKMQKVWDQYRCKFFFGEFFKIESQPNPTQLNPTHDSSEKNFSEENFFKKIFFFKNFSKNFFKKTFRWNNQHHDFEFCQKKIFLTFFWLVIQFRIIKKIFQIFFFTFSKKNFLKKKKIEKIFWKKQIFFLKYFFYESKFYKEF